MKLLYNVVALALSLNSVSAGKMMMMKRHYKNKKGGKPVKSVQLGARPFWLVDEMKDGHLKKELGTFCGEFSAVDCFSFGLDAMWTVKIVVWHHLTISFYLSSLIRILCLEIGQLRTS